MPLTHVDQGGIRELDGVLFPMADENDSGKTFGVLVTDQVLDSIADPPPTGDDEYVGRCEAYRGVFEDVASAAYDDGVTDRPIRVNTVRMAKYPKS